MERRLWPYVALIGDWNFDISDRICEHSFRFNNNMPFPNLVKIKTIVIVMMENRSFDHALGISI